MTQEQIVLGMLQAGDDVDKRSVLRLHKIKALNVHICALRRKGFDIGKHYVIHEGTPLTRYTLGT